MRFFENVSQEIWDFKIGNHQVLQNWLKSRKDIELQLVDIQYFTNLIKILAFTISLMKIIEKQTKDWV